MKKKLWLLVKKELLDWLYSFKTYIGLTAYLVLVGYLINLYVSSHNSTNIEGCLPNLMMLFVLFIPWMCVVSIRKEIKNGAHRLIMQSPTTVFEVMLSKFIGIYIICLGALCINAVQFILVRFIGVISFRLLATSLIGYAFLLMPLIALGLLLASITNNGYLNFSISFITLVLLLLMTYFIEYVPSVIKPVYDYISIFSDMQDFWILGRVNIHPILHAVSVAALSLYGAYLLLERRWTNEE